MYWYSVAGRNLALCKTKKVDNYIKSKSNALRADDVRVPVNGPVSELDLFGLCSDASPQFQVGVVDPKKERDNTSPSLFFHLNICMTNHSFICNRFSSSKSRPFWYHTLHTSERVPHKASR